MLIGDDLLIAWELRPEIGPVIPCFPPSCCRKTGSLMPGRSRWQPLPRL